jgi:2-oxoglutarate ferredoxin oxidoreductase subunit alpha
VEQNRDGQLAALLRMDLPPELATRLRAAASSTGLPLDADTVVEAVRAAEGR